MMKWGRKKPVSSSSSGLSWFSKFNASSDSKPAKENKKKKKKDDDEASKNMSAKSSLSSTKPRSNSFRVLEENAVATRKSTTDMESDEKFEEIMSSVRKKVRDFQIETRGGGGGGGGGGFLNVEDKGGTLMIMTPRIRDKPRFERRDPKLLEQKPPQRSKPPTRRTGTGREDSAVLGQTVKKPGHQWQKLKETKLREVKVKADQQQRKSLYMRRELNNSKVRVFSPRATEKCRVKAIEDLKKARAREDGDRGGTTTESESFAVVKSSNDPRKDFRDSMIEMIMENGINHPEELKELLVCYLRLNTDEYHDMIIKVFQQVYSDLNFHYFGVE